MLIDISRTLNAAIAVWPGDTRFSTERLLEKRQGASVNLTTMRLSQHTGTHADAPLHFDDAGAPLEQLPLEPYWGVAQVVTVGKAAGPLEPADFAHVDLRLAPRLLVHSRFSALDPAIFPAEIIHPTPALAAWLAAQGIILYGADTPSMDAVDSRTLPGHHALHRHGIAIVEGLLLEGVADGLYDFVALPLRIAGGDGSPVRAVLRRLATAR
jgi:arylformamidase